MIDAELLGGWFAWSSWAWIRLWAMLRVQPCWARVLGPSWWFVAAAGAAAWVGLTSAGAASDVPATWPGIGAWGVQALVEFGVGSVWGWLVALPTYAVIGAASETRRHLAGEQAGEALVVLVVALGLAFGTALNIHHLAFASVSDSLNLVPVGSSAGIESLGDPLQMVLRAARNVMSLSLALVTPILVAVVVTQSVVHALGRAFGPNRDPTTLAASWMVLSVVLLTLGASWMTFPYMWARAWA